MFAGDVVGVHVYLIGIFVPIIDKFLNLRVVVEEVNRLTAAVVVDANIRTVVVGGQVINNVHVAMSLNVTPIEGILFGNDSNLNLVVLV